MPLVPGARPSRASAARNDTSPFNRASAGVRAGTATVLGVSEPRSSAIAPRFIDIVTNSETTSALPSRSPKERRDPVSNTRKRMPAGPFSTSPFALDLLILKTVVDSGISPNSLNDNVSRLLSTTPMTGVTPVEHQYSGGFSDQRQAM